MWELGFLMDVPSRSKLDVYRLVYRLLVDIHQTSSFRRPWNDSYVSDSSNVCFKSHSRPSFSKSKTPRNFFFFYNIFPYQGFHLESTWNPRGLCGLRGWGSINVDSMWNLRRLIYIDFSTLILRRTHVDPSSLCYIHVELTWIYPRYFFHVPCSRIASKIDTAQCPM